MLEGSELGKFGSRPARVQTNAANSAQYCRMYEPLLPTIFKQLICYQRRCALRCAMFSLQAPVLQFCTATSRSAATQDGIDTVQYTYFRYSRLRVSVRIIILGPQVTGLLGNKAKRQRDREMGATGPEPVSEVTSLANTLKSKFNALEALI